MDNLAQAVAQNRTALVALTALKDYDNYTFTHMVNVSILTMAQARALGVEGALLREFGLAALMHDIGKVRTPVEILEQARQADRCRVRAHAHACRRWRRDPAPHAGNARRWRRSSRSSIICGSMARDIQSGIKPSTLNLGTMLCSIADVYDAMRSQRAYQESFPTDRDPRRAEAQ